MTDDKKKKILNTEIKVVFDGKVIQKITNEYPIDDDVV